MKSFVIFVITGMGFLISASASEWIWQNPYPTGNNLAKVFFADANHGIAYANGGEVLRTSDGGIHWDVTHHESPAISRAYFLNANLGWAFSGWSIYRTENGGVSWNQIGDPGVTLGRDVFFSTELIGWVCGWSEPYNRPVIYRTRDAGDTWALQYVAVELGNDSYGLCAIAFADTLHGWIVTDSGAILGTEDGGITWLYDSSPSGSHLYDVCTTGEGYRCAVGDGGTILLSDNSVWHSQASGTTESLLDIAFSRTNRGWIVGNSGTILTTMDGGISWAPEWSGTDRHLNSLSVFDNHNIWAVGEKGIILHSSDSGDWWGELSHGPSGHLLATSFVDSLYGWAVGVGAMVTDNGGEIWTVRSVPQNTLSSVSFINHDIGWIAGNFPGTICGTINGGTTWNEQYSVGLLINSVMFIDALHGWGVGGQSQTLGDTSLIVYSSDGGHSWTEQRRQAGGLLWDVCFLNETEGWAVGWAGTLLHTTDRGSTWLERPWDRQAYIWKVCFWDSNHGWILGTGGLFRTTDRGETWTNIGITLSDIAFIDAGHGWGVGRNGTIFKTTNGGATWQTEQSPTTNDLKSLAVVNRNQGWAVGDFGTILKYNTSSNNADERSNQPLNLKLLQAFPNPFNSSTTIVFDLPKAGHISLRVFDLLGREVAVLKDGIAEAGAHKIIFDGNTLASGVYFARLDAGTFSQTKKLMLLK